MLTHKCIVVLGGSTGLGLSAARAMAQCDAQIVVVGRNQSSIDAAFDQLNKSAPGSIRTLVGDAVDSATAERAIQVCLEEFGGFHGLYHVAGGSGRRFGDGPLDQVTDEGVQKTIELNLQSVIYSNRAAIRQFLAQDSGGVVLNMGSVLGSSPSPRYFSTHVYAATKAAIEGLTKASAAYYAPRNIRFNVVAPALVETPMAARATTDEQILDFVRTKQPLDGGRVGRPDDLDDLVVYLMSDHSRFVTGQVIAVDGGWSVSEGQYEK